MIEPREKDRRTRLLAALLVATLGLAPLAGCGSKNKDEVASNDEAPPAAAGGDAAESPPEAPAGKDARSDAAPKDDESAASKAPGKPENKVDFNDNEEMLKLARSSANSPGGPDGAAPAPGSSTPPSSAPAAPSAPPNSGAGPGMPGNKGRNNPPAGGPGAGPGSAGMVIGAQGANGGGGPKGVGGAGAPLLGDGPGAGGAGSPGIGGASGGNVKVDYRTPDAGAMTFLAALKAKDVELLSEAVALRSVTEAHSEDRREQFKAIREKAMDPGDLDAMADALSGMTIKDHNTAKSTGQLGVIIGKTKGRDTITRTLYMRKEKAGWKVMDISGEREMQTVSSGMGGRRPGRRR